MTTSPQAERTAQHILAKYLRKGNMARCLRDILPGSHLTFDERQHIADTMHTIVRWKHLYTHLLTQQGQTPNPEAFLTLAATQPLNLPPNLPPEYHYSCSPYVATIFTQHPDWADYLNTNPPTTLCVNLNKATREGVLRILHAELFHATPGQLPTAVVCPSSSAKNTTLVTEHLVHVQDESSQLAASLAVDHGDHLLDFCAGNGGKTLTIASLTKNTKSIAAFETKPERRQKLQQRCLDYGANVSVESQLPSRAFDLILVDAPCSGLGAARRNPEAKYIPNAGEYPNIQESILKHAAEYLTPTGSLLYVVCTITPEETTQVVSTFTSKAPFEPQPLSAPEGFLTKTLNGYFTSIAQGDLFFISLLQKHS